MENKPIEPIIRWAGSKRKLLPLLEECYADSKKSHYLEPFCGSACLFLRVNPKTALLSDLNKELIQTYETIRYSPKKLHASLISRPITDKYYYWLRSNDPKSLSKFERAARFLYLNRFSFNGIYRTNKSGQYNVPRGTHTGNIPSELSFQSVARRFAKSVLFHGDFQHALKAANRETFVYMDPPYIYSGLRNRGEYGRNSFNGLDIARVDQELERLDQIGARFVLSYIDKPEIETIRDKWNFIEVEVSRQIGGFKSRRNVISELIIKNF